MDAFCQSTKLNVAIIWCIFHLGLKHISNSVSEAWDKTYRCQ